MAKSQASTGAGDTEITLGLLNAVEKNSDLTQRSASRDLGIALGLTNAYLRRCVSKGLIKVRQIPRKRYAYYLTPKGFAEKSRLTAEYLSSSFNFFRKARSQLSELFVLCEQRNWRRIALWGSSELAEIATLCAREHGVVLVGIQDSRSKADTFAGLKVSRLPGQLGAVDAVILTETRAPQAAFDEAAATFDPERILTPNLLRLAHGRNR